MSDKKDEKVTVEEEVVHTADQSHPTVEDVISTSEGPSEESLKKVQEILSSSSKEGDLPKSMRNLMTREANNNRRIQESIQGAKTNPVWFIPLFCALLVLGVAWIVVNYITNGVYPIPQIGRWNLLVGFGILMLGFIMTMWWN